MADELFFIFNLLGTIAFAISGAHLGNIKKMDVLGVSVLGIVTAVGGGIMRDILVGNIPPAAFVNPVYFLLALVVSIIIFLPVVRKTIRAHEKIFERIVFIADAVGLGVFTVSGIKIAHDTLPDGGAFLIIFVGVVTGVGGGVIRDIMASETPVIFVKQFYACASLIGAVLSYLLWGPVGEIPAMLIGIVIVVILRIMAARYNWHLPRAK